MKKVICWTISFFFFVSGTQVLCMKKLQKKLKESKSHLEEIKRFTSGGITQNLYPSATYKDEYNTTMEQLLTKLKLPKISCNTFTELQGRERGLKLFKELFRAKIALEKKIEHIETIATNEKNTPTKNPSKKTHAPTKTSQKKTKKYALRTQNLPDYDCFYFSILMFIIFSALWTISNSQ